MPVALQICNYQIMVSSGLMQHIGTLAQVTALLEYAPNGTSEYTDRMRKREPMKVSFPVSQAVV